MEVGGRWSQESYDFIYQLAVAKARSAPALLRKAATLGFFNRWATLLSTAALNSFAASLLELPLGSCCNVDGAEPSVAEVCADARWLEAPVNSAVV